MKKLLLELNISNKASEIYLYVLQNGVSSVAQIAKAIGVNRTAVYPYISELEKVKLISWSEREKDKAIQASPPEILEKLIKQKEAKVKKLRTQFNEQLPTLKSMYKATDDQFLIQKFVGRENVREALQIVYKSKVQQGYCGDLIYEALGKSWYDKHLCNMYKVHNIKDRVIFPSDIITPQTYKKLRATNWYDEKLAEYRYNKNLKMDKNLDVYILKDCVITIYNEPEVTCIINKSKQYRD